MGMDSTGDDFGELYVDDKVQASDTFAGNVGFEESESVMNSGKRGGFEGTVKPDSEGETKKFGVVANDSSPSDDACALNLTEANEESEYSDTDSEDDLNIVLKDDDSKTRHGPCVSNTNNGGNAAAEACAPAETCSFQKRRTRNWSTWPNGGMVNGQMTMVASAKKTCIDPYLGTSQGGYSFSHTWSRTTFDGNFDVFDKKPWRNPDTNISDFFNFGFNEQSWKDYCKPLGRAIEVGGGTFERIPSADICRTRDSDPDVVIQIPLTNDDEELSSMTPVKARSLSITSNEASRSEDSHSNNGKDLNSIDDSIKDEAFVGCQDENTGSYNGEQSPPTENCCSRDLTPCDKNMIEEEKEENFCNSDETDSSSVERESSLGDRIRLSPTSSCSVGKSEESDDYETNSLKDSATDDQREVSTPPRRALLAEHEAISIKSREKSGTKHSRHRRFHEDSSKRHCGRAGYAAHERVKHRTVKDASPTADPVRGKRVCSRYGSLNRYSNKNWQNEPLTTLERDETEGLHYPNRQKYHGRSYSYVDHARHREHRFDWCNNKESSLGRGFDHFTSYKFEAHLKEYTPRSSFSRNQRKFRSSFKEEDDQYGRHHYERKYGSERSPVRAYENNKERNGYDWLREPYNEDSIPITDMDYRYGSGYSSTHELHNLKQGPANDLHGRRRDDYYYDLYRHRYEDGCHRAESRIPHERAYREMHLFAEEEMGEYQGYKRHEEYSEIDRRHHHTHDWHLDRFVSEKDDCKYRTQDAWPSSSLSLRDSWYTKEAKRDFWRYDTRDARTAEAYDSQNSQLYKGAPRDGWTQNLGHSDNVSFKDRLKYDDDWVRSDRGRYKLADDIRRSRREVTRAENPSYTDELLVRDIRIPTRNRISTKHRSGYFKSHVHEIDERHHRSKKLKGDGNAFIKYQHPVDLTGRQGQLSNQSKRGFSNDEYTVQQHDCQKPRKLICRREEKAAQIRDLNDKEEGEIIEEARNVKGIEIDNERIQESLKKMEKRRERFKETKLAVEATFESQAEPKAKIDVTNQQRPVRKRRWCAS